VDGRLPASREEVVLLALKADPRLGTLVRAMRQDRAGLLDLGRADARLDPAPEGLHDAIAARLDAEALRGLAAEAEAAPGSIPVSTIEPETPGVLRILVESVWARRLSMAAAVVIVAGVGVLGWREARRAGLVPGGTTPIARGDRPTLTPAPSTDTSVAHATPAPDAPATIEPEAPATTVAAADDPATAPETVPTPPAAPALTPERVLALASTRRLAVTVFAPPGDAARATLKRLDTLARAAGREGGWDAYPLGPGHPAAPTALAALTVPSTPAPTPDAPAIAMPTPTAVAGEHGGPTPVLPATGAPALNVQPRPAVRALYTAQVDPRPGAVEALLKVVRDGLPEGVRVTLRELAAPLPAPEPALDPESVLWWTAPAGGWSVKPSVPIVVETME
jgi:hypothetical protein